MHAPPRFSTALFGLALVAVGIHMATDFRAFSAWYAKRYMSSAERSLRRIEPWKTILQRPMEGRARRRVWLIRAIGTVLAGCGVSLLLYAAFAKGPIFMN